MSKEEQLWDESVRRAGNPHLLQSFRWGELQSDFGWKVERLTLDLQGAQVPVSALTRSGFAYVPRGPAVTADRMAAALAALEEVARLQGWAFVRVEPEIAEGFAPPPGWVTAPATQPRRSSILDLRPEADELLAGFKPKTRYNIRLAEKRGVKVEVSDDVAAFARIEKVTQARHGIRLPPEAYFRRICELFAPNGYRLYLARKGSELLAGIIVMRFADRATYLFGASSDAHRELMPAYALQWRAITDARGDGATEYDLWGVPPDDDPHHPLAGLKQFKAGWNGRLVAYAGAFDFPVNRAAWRLSRIASALRSRLRGVRR